jgi:PhnB protein
MYVNPYLHFNGQCEAAFQFYAQCLGGQIVAMMPHRGSPAEAHAPAEFLDKIMHARLVSDSAVLMGSDVPADRFVPPAGFSVSVVIPDPERAERIFHALAEGGQVQMPIQQTFWSPRFGMLKDKYGIPWMVNCEPAAA